MTFLVFLGRNANQTASLKPVCASVYRLDLNALTFLTFDVVHDVDAQCSGLKPQEYNNRLRMWWPQKSSYTPKVSVILLLNSVLASSVKTL